MLVERIRVGGQYFKHSRYLAILLDWHYQHGPNAHFFAQSRVNPPIGISVVAEQDFAGSETKPGEADARLQTHPYFWNGGTSGGSAAQNVFCAERNNRSRCPSSLHCLLQNGLKFGFVAHRFFASRSRDRTELGCAVLNVSS
jgi:hypothetical protein